ncbi:putative RNA-directed DNA polymerase, eukaryota, reverse transcriptase zinc-binding domain protein [Tanacetum coccineum]
MEGLRESLVLFLPDKGAEIPACGVWKIEDDGSFTKLFTFNTPNSSIRKIASSILGFIETCLPSSWHLTRKRYFYWITRIVVCILTGNDHGDEGVELQSYMLSLEVEPHQVKEVFLNFYKDKFQANELVVSFSPVAVSSILNFEDRLQLEGVVCMDEIKATIWDYGSEKAPGPNGFSFDFVKRYWESIKMDIYEFVSSFFETGKMPMGFNSSIITLLPKVSNPIHIQDFRPMSLIGIQYKIITKILANRLSKVVRKLVSHEQSAFISGRQILDGPLMLNEIIDWYKKRHKKMLIFKVDFKKAYDSVHWNYLDFMLNNLGLHSALYDAVSSGLIRGIKFDGSSVHLSHLFYADDVVIMTKWSSQYMDNIIHVLRVFFLVSCLKINIYKSNVYGVGVSLEEVNDMVRITRRTAGSFPFVYLGLPIGSNMNHKANWKNLMDQFHTKLSSWKANLLSIDGHLTLIKLVLGSLAIYYFSMLKVPETILKSMESLRASFLWIKWSNVMASFDKGDLGIGSLKSFYLTLLQKWRWRFASNLSSLWVRLIQALHGQEGSFDQHGCKINGLWAKIVGSSNHLHSSGILLTDSLRFKVGCSTLIHFCKDMWLGDYPLSELGTRNVSSLNVLLVKIGNMEVTLELDACVWSLAKDGMEIQDISCPSCNVSVESNQHIFFVCDIARSIWQLIRVWCDISMPQFDSIDDWRDWLSS